MTRTSRSVRHTCNIGGTSTRDEGQTGDAESLAAPEEKRRYGVVPDPPAGTKVGAVPSPIQLAHWKNSPRKSSLAGRRSSRRFLLKRLATALRFAGYFGIRRVSCECCTPRRKRRKKVAVSQGVTRAIEPHPVITEKTRRNAHPRRILKKPESQQKVGLLRFSPVTNTEIRNFAL